MDKHERWRGLFSHPDRLERWQAFARGAEKKIGAFLQFDPQLALADGCRLGRRAATPWPACPSESRTSSPCAPSA